MKIITEKMEIHENKWEFVNIQNVSPNLNSEDFLSLMDLSFSDFYWKKIASIGAWFWILEMDIAKVWKTEVEVVDPIYNTDETRNKSWEKTYARISKKQKMAKPKNNYLEESIENLNNILLTPDEFDSRTEQQIINDLLWKESLRKRRELLYQNKQKILENLLNRKNQRPNNLKINWSFWEDIKWIEYWSKDYIFINHLLYKFQKKIIKFLQQADNLLKDDWKIYIIDYVWEIDFLEKYFKQNWTYKSIWWEFWWALKKWEYLNLNR